MMKKSQKKTSLLYPRKNDSEGLRNTVRNHIIDLTREKEGGFSVNSCEWKNPNNKNASSKGAGVKLDIKIKRNVNNPFISLIMKVND